MNGEQKFYFGVWALCLVAAVLLIGGGIFAGVLQGNNDHDFDRVCIQHGKSVTYITLPGTRNEYKVCK